jgi:magnesium chelatase subunit D
VREAWLAAVARLSSRPALRLPPVIEDDRLYGGIDLVATLAAGRPVRSPGIAEIADGRALVLPMAERCAAGFAARLGQMIDAGRDVALVALDEGASPDEVAPEGLADRLAFHLDLDGISLREADAPSDWCAAEVRAAQARLERVRVPPEAVERLTVLAAMLGIDSLRAPLLALRAARARSALAGAVEVGPEAEAEAARLVLGPRAVRFPESPPPETDPPPAEPSESSHDQVADRETPEGEPSDAVPDEMLLEAARAAIPADLLARLLAGRVRERRRRAAGAGVEEIGFRRGRPCGVLTGRPRDGARIAVVDTLRAAAPWQSLRRRMALEGLTSGPSDLRGLAERVLVHPEDIRLKRFRRRAERVAIFAVDASGSTALTRLAEAKGAIELLLGQAYVERQSVALIAFRGSGAEVLLPPTRSLVLAKRRLAGLPGGGGTPLAAGIAEALALAALSRAKGTVPTLALLTDGKANVARDGTHGRPRAEADALETARAVRAQGLAAVVIDTSQRPSPPAKALADAMAAEYLPLPRADARALAGAMQGVLGGAA